MAASLPGPLGGQLAGAEGRGVPDRLPPVLRRRGARVLRAGAIGFQPPGGRTQELTGGSAAAGGPSIAFCHLLLPHVGRGAPRRPQAMRGRKACVAAYLRRCASWQLQCQAFLESVRVSILSKGKLRGSCVSRLFSRCAAFRTVTPANALSAN